jgi:hypothetical protein
MTSSNLILKQEAESAFLAVMTIGTQAADRVAAARAAMDPVAESMAVAFGNAAIDDAIMAHPQALSVIQRMAGHKWGFKTDQDNFDGSGSTYKPDVIVPCFRHAMLERLRPVGNEFNILQSSMYVTKEGWNGLISRLPGVTELDSRPGAIVDYEVREFTTKKGYVKKKITASVSATADCNVWGKFVQVCAWKTPNSDERLQLTVIADEIDEALDQLKGKADARILERLHGKVKALALAGPDGVPQSAPGQVESPRIEVQAASQKTITEEPSDARKVQKAGFDGWHKAAQTRVTDAAQLAVINEYWSEIANATNKDQLRLLHQDLTKNQVKPLGKNNVDELCRWCAWNAEVLP